jgi:hypothetical protein
MSHDASIQLPCFCGKVLYITVEYLSYHGRELSDFMVHVSNIGINCTCRFLWSWQWIVGLCELILQTYILVLKSCWRRRVSPVAGISRTTYVIEWEAVYGDACMSKHFHTDGMYFWRTSFCRVKYCFAWSIVPATSRWNFSFKLL